MNDVYRKYDTSLGGSESGGIAKVVAKVVDDAGMCGDSRGALALDRIERLADILGFFAERLSPEDQEELAEKFGWYKDWIMSKIGQWVMEQQEKEATDAPYLEALEQKYPGLKGAWPERNRVADNLHDKIEQCSQTSPMQTPLPCSTTVQKPESSAGENADAASPPRKR